MLPGYRWGSWAGAGYASAYLSMSTYSVNYDCFSDQRAKIYNKHRVGGYVGCVLQLFIYFYFMYFFYLFYFYNLDYKNNLD